MCNAGWFFNPDITEWESRLPPDQAFPAGCGYPGRHSPAEAGTPGHSYPGYFSTFISRISIRCTVFLPHATPCASTPPTIV
jgi:hypothetical protein